MSRRRTSARSIADAPDIPGFVGRGREPPRPAGNDDEAGAHQAPASSRRRSVDQTSLNSPSTVSSSEPPDPPDRAPAPAGSASPASPASEPVPSPEPFEP